VRRKHIQLQDVIRSIRFIMKLKKSIFKIEM
jgi:hypothetical protein